jgi:hypothetical protein
MRKYYYYTFFFGGGIMLIRCLIVESTPLKNGELSYELPYRWTRS